MHFCYKYVWNSIKRKKIWDFGVNLVILRVESWDVSQKVSFVHNSQESSVPLTHYWKKEVFQARSLTLIRCRRQGPPVTELLEQWHELTMITIHDNQSVFQGSKVATSIFQRKVPPKGANFDFFMGKKSLFPTETLPTNFFETVSKNVSNLQQ